MEEINREEWEEEDLLRIETDVEAFEVELRAEALLNAADAHAAAAYEAVVWYKLPGGGHGAASGVPVPARERTWTGMVRTLYIWGSGGKACLELEVTCRYRLLRLNRMALG